MQCIIPKLKNHKKLITSSEMITFLTLKNAKKTYPDHCSKGWVTAKAQKFETAKTQRAQSRDFKINLTECPVKPVGTSVSVEGFREHQTADPIHYEG